MLGCSVKQIKERVFAYNVHTTCDAWGIVVDFQVTSGNVHDINEFIPLIDKVNKRGIEKITHAVADSGYKGPVMTHQLEKEISKQCYLIETITKLKIHLENQIIYITLIIIHILVPIMKYLDKGQWEEMH